MKNVSIRTRLLASIVLVNLLGAVVTAVYLHQSFSGGLEIKAREATKVSAGAWNDIANHSGIKLDSKALLKDAPAFVQRMKEITGSEYGLLVSKDGLDEKAYEKARAAKGQANDWSERDNYVLGAATGDASAEKMKLEASADSIPEIGKFVGIENGSCSRTCHGTVKGTGDFWQVSWSTDANSRAHSVQPIVDASGKPIGVLYSIQDITAAANADKGSLIRTLVIIVIGLLAATLLIGAMLDTLVFKRLKAIMAGMEDMTMRIAGGAFDAHYTPDGSTDEIGQFQQTFGRFVEVVVGTLASVMKKSA